MNLALRKALLRYYPELKDVHLTDYKVRILDTNMGTAAVTRVLISFRNGKRCGVRSEPVRISSKQAGRRWPTAWSMRCWINNHRLRGCRIGQQSYYIARQSRWRDTFGWWVVKCVVVDVAVLLGFNALSSLELTRYGQVFPLPSRVPELPAFRAWARRWRRPTRPRRNTNP